VPAGGDPTMPAADSTQSDADPMKAMEEAMKKK
jgi:hypothetical protein